MKSIVLRLAVPFWAFRDWSALLPYALVLATCCMNSPDVGHAAPGENDAGTAGRQLRAALADFSESGTAEDFKKMLDTIRTRGEGALPAVPSLIATVPILSWDACEQLSDALASLGNVAVGSMERYASHSDAKVRFVIIHALARMDDLDRHCKYFIAALDDSAYEVRSVAVGALHKARAKEAYEPLRRVSLDAAECENLRFRAALATAAIDLQRSTSWAAVVVRGKDRASRRAAYLILGYSGRIDVLAPICSKQLETDPIAQWELITGLAITRHETAKAILRDMLQNPTAYGTTRAARSHVEKALHFAETGEAPRREDTTLIFDNAFEKNGNE